MHFLRLLFRCIFSRADCPARLVGNDKIFRSLRNHALERPLQLTQKDLFCLAGFALVHHKSKLSAADDVWDMAEFFVLRRHRRAGVGMRAAHILFETHAGAWEVRQRAANAAATIER